MHQQLIFKSSPVGSENSRRKILGEKPSLGSSWWDLNLWPLTPQSSALTTRPPNTPYFNNLSICTLWRHLYSLIRPSHSSSHAGMVRCLVAACSCLLFRQLLFQQLTQPVMLPTLPVSVDTQTSTCMHSFWQSIQLRLWWLVFKRLVTLQNDFAGKTFTEFLNQWDNDFVLM